MGLESCKTFGDVLMLARGQMSEGAFCAHMREAGYPLSRGTLFSIEYGYALPRDPEPFLRAVFKTLHLSAKTGIGRALTLHLAYDLLERDLGKYTGMLDAVLPTDFRHCHE